MTTIQLMNGRSQPADQVQFDVWGVSFQTTGEDGKHVTIPWHLIERVERPLGESQVGVRR